MNEQKQQELQLKVEKAQKEGLMLYPFDIVTNQETGEYERVVLFEEELTDEHKQYLLQNLTQLFRTLPKDVQDKFVQIVSKTKLTDKLIITN